MKKVVDRYEEDAGAKIYFDKSEGLRRFLERRVPQAELFC